MTRRRLTSKQHEAEVIRLSEEQRREVRRAIDQIVAAYLNALPAIKALQDAFAQAGCNYARAFKALADQERRSRGRHP